MIRRATPADADSIARVHVATWRAAYRGIVPDGYLHALSAEARAARWRADLAGTATVTWVAVSDDGEIAGFATRSAATAPAELYAIYVAAPVWGQGLGRALLEAAGAGCDGVGLWVFEENPRARRFYEAAGFRPEGSRRLGVRGGVEAAEVRYMLSPPSTSMVRPLK